MEQTRTPVTICLIGAGAGAGAGDETAARGLRGVDGVIVRSIEGGEDALLAALSDEAVDAIAVVGPVADLASTIRRILMSRRHALVTAPVALASKHLVALDELARRRSRVLMFDAGYAADDRFAFVRRMTAGPTALWRPRYIRSLRVVPVSATGASLDETAVAEIEAVLSITGLPSRISAFAPRIDDETGAADAATVTLAWDGGLIARIDVSLMEPEPRRELVIACDGRTIVLDAFDMHAPMRIAAGGRHRIERAGAHWAETVSEHPMIDAPDRAYRAAEVFVTSVRSRDAEAGNARDFAAAALVWETARESITRWGEPIAPPSEHPLVPGTRPELQVILGGGNRIESVAPELSIVPRTRAVSGGRSPSPDAA